MIVSFFILIYYGESTMNEFASNLKAIRLKRNLKQIDVARALNISQPAYSRYEVGSNQPDFDMLIQIAKFFDVSTDYILGRYKS